MPLEQVIRPFQSPAVVADKRRVVTRPANEAPEKAIIIWGAAGQAPSIEGMALKVNNKTKTLKESSRKTSTVRIENPDDSNQYVMEKRIDSISFDVTDLIKTPSSKTAKDAGNNSGSNGGANDGTATGTPPSAKIVNNPQVENNQPEAAPDYDKEAFTLTHEGGEGP